jgi:rod shape-determining protein MreD
MKKIIIYISLIITFILIYLLQAMFFTNFTIADVMPNLIVILMLFIGLYMGRCRGVIFGIIFGILVDMWIGKDFGITSTCFALIGFLGGIFDKNFSKESRITVILMGAICTIIYEVMVCVLKYFTIGLNIETIEFIKILCIEVIYNILLTTILYPIIKKVGYEIESEIKGNKIFTRYF